MEQRRSALLALLSFLPHACALSTAALPLHAPSHLQRRLSPCVLVFVDATPFVEPEAGGLLRLSGLRRVYGEYAARCDEDACSERPVARFVTRPLRWVRALFPKPRPLAQLSMCEGGTFKVRRDGPARVMIFEEESIAPDSCVISGFDLL